MNHEQIRAYAAERAEPPEQSELFWLSPPDGDQGHEDYCGECIGIIAALPTLVFCHLNLLRGEFVAPGVHNFTEEDGRHSHRCTICDAWEGSSDRACWDAPRQAIEWNKAAVDGGWTSESDGWRNCENCGKELYVNLTDHAVSAEMSHWKHYGPPTCGHDWWAFNEMIGRLMDDDKHWKTIEELFAKWGLSVMKSILFQREMILAILAKKKRATRRIMKVGSEYFVCPYGGVGSELLAKESAWVWCRKVRDGDTKTGRPKHNYIPVGHHVIYQADQLTRPSHRIDADHDTGWRLKIGRYLPASMCRIKLTLSSRKIQRLHDITDEEARAEGVADRAAFQALWVRINGQASWAANPYVWVLGWD